MRSQWQAGPILPLPPAAPPSPPAADPPASPRPRRPGKNYAASSFTPAMNSRSVFLASPSTIIVFGWTKSSFSIAREARVHAALEHDDRPRLLDVEHRHAVDRARRVGLRRRVHDVVRADDQRHVGAGEVVVDLVEVEELVVGDVRLGEQHVHVPRHAAGDRMDGVLHRRRRSPRAPARARAPRAAPARPPCRSRGPRSPTAPP